MKQSIEQKQKWRWVEFTFNTVNFLHKNIFIFLFYFVVCLFRWFYHFNWMNCSVKVKVIIVNVHFSLLNETVLFTFFWVFWSKPMEQLTNLKLKPQQNTWNLINKEKQQQPLRWQLNFHRTISYWVHRKTSVLFAFAVTHFALCWFFLWNLPIFFLPLLGSTKARQWTMHKSSVSVSILFDYLLESMV